MKVLCLSKTAIPYVNGTSICVASLLRALMAAGHDVRLLTAKDAPDMGDSPWLPQRGWENVGCDTTFVEAEGHTPPGRCERWFSKLASTADPLRVPCDEDPVWVYAAERALLKEIGSFLPDVVLSTDPPGGHWAALRARCSHDFTWVASLDDPWDRRTMFEQVPWYSLSHLQHRRVISLIASKADAFIFPSKRLANFERQFSFGPWPSCEEIIPHLGTVTEKAAPRTPGTFRLVHVGDLRPRGRADCLLPEALHNAVTTEPDLADEIEVVFVGDVPEHFRRRMERSIGSAFQWVPPCPYPVSLEYIASADVNMVIERKSAVSILMQSKLADYAMVDAPIVTLGPAAGNLADLAQAGECLHAVPDDEAGMADNILALYRAWKTGEPRKYRHDKLKLICEPEHGARQFESLMRAIVGRTRTAGEEDASVGSVACVPEAAVSGGGTEDTGQTCRRG